MVLRKCSSQVDVILQDKLLTLLSQFLVILNLCKISEIILKSAVSLIGTYFYLTLGIVYTHIIRRLEFYFDFHLALYTSIIFCLLLCQGCPFSTYPFVTAFVRSMCHSALNELTQLANQWDPLRLVIFQKA